jgi:hypothetical protein
MQQGKAKQTSKKRLNQVAYLRQAMHQLTDVYGTPL